MLCLTGSITINLLSESEIAICMNFVNCSFHGVSVKQAVHGIHTEGDFVLTLSEKNRIINEFEITIDKLTTGYQSSKDFYLETIKKQEQQLNDYSKGYKIDTEKLNNIIKELQNKIIELQNDNNLIINMNTELKKENTY